ncbi:MAG: hypothetical protein FD165_544 [Gammaproteobacteria bacterium]|nr:MAG: hypothetical protein FD165_544 [Gammaproteobacteria bacterium]TND02194.1 MAG: hypothetical protein FD120_2358 [Gammaproteobacteria bacterium]
MYGGRWKNGSALFRCASQPRALNRHRNRRAVRCRREILAAGSVLIAEAVARTGIRVGYGDFTDQNRRLGSVHGDAHNMRHIGPRDAIALLDRRCARRVRAYDVGAPVGIIHTRAIYQPNRHSNTRTGYLSLVMDCPGRTSQPVPTCRHRSAAARRCRCTRNYRAYRRCH